MQNLATSSTSGQNKPRKTSGPQLSNHRSFSFGSVGHFTETPDTKAPQKRTCLTSKAQPRPPSLQQLHCERHPTARLCVVIAILQMLHHENMFHFFCFLHQLQLPHGIAAFDYNGSNTGELSFQVSQLVQPAGIPFK